MKPTKSPRIGSAHRNRSSRTADSHTPQPSPTHLRRPSLTGHDQRESQTQPARMEASTGESRSATSTAEDVAELEHMKMRMSDALALKQLRKSASRSPSSGPGASGEPTNPTAPSLNTRQSSEESLPSGTLSTDSAKTIKAGFDMTPGAVRTPSYPFPRMRLNLHRGTSHRSAPSHKPFTLLSPTVTPLQEGETKSRLSAEPGSSEVSTPIGQKPTDEQTCFEDPNFPTPDLYDMILVLYSEPGLDAWWANTSQILAEAFGAERASLAVPTDATDLENVPWGQKATFNLYGTDGPGSLNFASSSVSEFDLVSTVRRSERQSTATADPTPPPRRPPLHTRHSIAGVIPEAASRGPRQRPPGPMRATSSISGQYDREPSSASPRTSRQPLLEETSSTSESPTPKQLNESSASVSSTFRCYVHRSIQPLESEDDSLLVRTGVARLFGKRRPIVLTRAYNDEGPISEPSPKDDSRARTSSQSSLSTQSGQDEGGQQTRLLRAFDEYEQPEPSPWSRSPAPSPTARPDPAESPFFTQAATIDETAFEQNPPAYDYAATANQSLQAIGADASKTLIHIPLIQSLPSRGILASTLRFPVAILSMLSPINPYPRNLRHSLNKLLPHLASSYSLAQQYSALLTRLRGHGSVGHGVALGLGGTFSDQGSELELVAELSEQIARDKGKERAEKSRPSLTSPTDRASSSSRSRPGSATGTPMLEHYGLAAGIVSTPGRSGTEMVDSYFLAKRQKGGQHNTQPTTPGVQPVSEESPEKTRMKPQSTTRSASKKVAISSPKFREDPTVPPPPRSASIASESDNGDQQQFLIPERSDTGSFRRSSQHQDSPPNERPLPELISQLMLNSVPLQLFLAKPKSGDLVWTNRKFDAFRSQGEGRVRDPWKNVHPADRSGLVEGWTEALKSGSQFTHYVRVKRFNSDCDFRWFIFRASTLLASNGRLLYWIGSFMDVHEQYMKSLDANERAATVARDAKLRALADSIPQILFEAVEGEGIVAVNQQWHAFSGQTLEDARGLGFARQVHREDLYKCGVLSPADVALLSRAHYAHISPSDSSESSNRTAVQGTATSVHPQVTSWQVPDSIPLERLIEQGVISIEKDENGRLFYSTEIRLRSKGGEFRWFLVRLVKVESELINNGRSSWYGTCTDIDVRKGLERELNQANKKVHQEMESKTKFFANMSHEIRTPLNGILGSMPWLVESQLDHDQRRTVDVIQNSSNNLRELVDNILDVTKVEAGKMALVYKWFHVRTLLEEIIDTISSRAIERGLELNYTIDANVPSVVKGDSFRLRQILLNLMGNSVKFTEQGEIYTRCSASTGKATDPAEPNSILLSFDVVDTGRGFNPTEFQRIFQQFGQIDGGSSHDAGSGLGLFLSKQLVEMHGGHLSAQSKAGEGSTFTFYVKVEVAPPGSTASSSPLGKPTTHRSSASLGGNHRSRSDSRTPTMALSRTSVLASPGRHVGSPEVQSPGLVSPGSSDPSIRSQSLNLVQQSSTSSTLPTPESGGSGMASASPSERQQLAEKALAALPELKRSRSNNDGSGLAPDKAYPTTYSVIVICPAEHARAAIKQHIEQVVPHQIPANVSTISDIGQFLDLMHGPTNPNFTHIVLDLPASSDVMLFLRQMSHFTAPVIPATVVITDHYQKRDILEDFEALKGAGRQVHLVNKPVKPAVFAMIFDPSQLRNLSKDATRSTAQSNTDNFKFTAERVKGAIGGKGFRVLLVEDSDTNRKVILRYLAKVDLLSETASNGLECTEMVLSKPHGYYSLIICDIQMPKKNGYEACSEVRQWESAHRYPPIPIMALTANAMPEERAAAGKAGFTDYLTKPVSFNLLGTMMMMLLDPKVPHVFLRDRSPES